MDCVICGNPIITHPITGWDRGNNAEPVKEGRCCDTCDQTVVIPRRMSNAIEGNDPYEGKGLWVVDKVGSAIDPAEVFADTVGGDRASDRRTIIVMAKALAALLNAKAPPSM